MPPQEVGSGLCCVGRQVFGSFVWGFRSSGFRCLGFAGLRKFGHNTKNKISQCRFG